MTRLFQIRSRFDGRVLFELECGSLRICLEAGVAARADLADADLADANLAGADLADAYLADADLARADLADANLAPHAICPAEGSFIAYKKVSTGTIKIEIPAEAKRTSSHVGRKCRAEFVRVIAGSGKSERGGEYVEGEIYRPDWYDPDPRIECSHGVHFFVTMEEAEQW